MGSLRLFRETFRFRLDFSPLDLSQPIASNSLTAYSTATFDRKPALRFTERVYPLVFEPIFFYQWGDSTEEPRQLSFLLCYTPLELLEMAAALPSVKMPAQIKPTPMPRSFNTVRSPPFLFS